MPEIHYSWKSLKHLSGFYQNAVHADSCCGPWGGLWLRVPTVVPLPLRGCDVDSPCCLVAGEAQLAGRSFSHLEKWPSTWDPGPLNRFSCHEVGSCAGPASWAPGTRATTATLGVSRVHGAVHTAAPLCAVCLPSTPMLVTPVL